MPPTVPFPLEQSRVCRLSFPVELPPVYHLAQPRIARRVCEARKRAWISCRFSAPIRKERREAAPLLCHILDPCDEPRFASLSLADAILIIKNKKSRMSHNVN